MAIKSRFADSAPSSATYRAQGLMSVVERSPQVPCYGFVFFVLPPGLVTLRIRGVGTHDYDDPAACPVSRVLDALSRTRFSRASELNRETQSIDIHALPGGSRGCGRCELRAMAFQGVCDRLNIALTMSNILREVRRIDPAAWLTTPGQDCAGIARRQVCPADRTAVRSVGAVDALREVGRACDRLEVCPHASL